MSLAAYLGITFGAAVVAWLARPRPPVAAAVGLVGLSGAVIAAVGIDPDQSLAIGGAAVNATAYVRLFLILGSLTGLALAAIGLATGVRRDLPAVTLGALGALAVALVLRDARIAVIAATAGGLLGALLTLDSASGRIGATAGIRATRAVVVAGAMAVAATAWIGRDLSELAAQPVVFGLAYLAFGIAVAVRFGAIPFHVWAARLTDTVPEIALPIVTAWSAAAFSIVALAWTDGSIAPLLVTMEAERGIMLGLGLVSIVLAAFAGWIQDDLEHVVGYSIIGDAGVVLLAMATLDPSALAPARLWILAYVVARSAFAAWAAAVRATFGTGRLPELRGWALRSPVLGVVLLGIVLAGIGVPGLAAFEARATLVDLAFGGPVRLLVVVATLLPLAYYGRVLAIGLGRPSDELAGPNGWAGLPHRTPMDLTHLRTSWAAFWAVNRAASTVALTGLLTILAVVVAVGGLGGPSAAEGVGPGVEGPSGSFPVEGPGATLPGASAPAPATPGEPFTTSPSSPVASGSGSASPGASGAAPAD